MAFPEVAPRPDVRVREIEPADEPALQAVFAAAGDWFVALTGDHAHPGDVQSLFWSAPEGVPPEDKLLLVVEHDGEVAGIVDAVPGFPAADDCSIGVFLLSPAHRRRGVGTVVARALLDAAGERGITRVTVAVPQGWEPGVKFLSHLGFTIGEPFDPRTGHGNLVIHRGQSVMVRASLLRPVEGGPGV